MWLIHQIFGYNEFDTKAVHLCSNYDKNSGSILNFESEMVKVFESLYLPSQVSSKMDREIIQEYGDMFSEHLLGKNFNYILSFVQSNYSKEIKNDFSVDHILEEYMREIGFDVDSKIKGNPEIQKKVVSAETKLTLFRKDFFVNLFGDDEHLLEDFKHVSAIEDDGSEILKTHYKELLQGLSDIFEVSSDAIKDNTQMMLMFYNQNISQSIKADFLTFFKQEMYFAELNQLTKYIKEDYSVDTSKALDILVIGNNAPDDYGYDAVYSLELFDWQNRRYNII